jgi:raffinose/stachyose/melibiose transport system permease protein
MDISQPLVVKAPRKKVHIGLIILEIIGIILTLMFLAPFFLVILNATRLNSYITEAPLSFQTASFVNFVANLNGILNDPSLNYLASFLHSIIITTGSLIVIVVFSSMAAWVLVRTKKRYSSLIFLLFVAGYIIPFQVVMFPLVRVMTQFYNIFGIKMLDTYRGTILAYLGFGAPLSIFLYHGFIKSIPMDIEEAAIIDGCSKPQLFFRIIFPILKPITITLLVLNGMWIWNDFLLPLLIIKTGGHVQTLPLAVANFAGSFVQQWNLMLTSVLFAALPVVILFLFAQRYIIQGMTSGAIK